MVRRFSPSGFRPRFAGVLAKYPGRLLRNSELIDWKVRSTIPFADPLAMGARDTSMPNWAQAEWNTTERKSLPLSMWMRRGLIIGRALSARYLASGDRSGWSGRAMLTRVRVVERSGLFG